MLERLKKMFEGKPVLVVDSESPSCKEADFCTRVREASGGEYVLDALDCIYFFTPERAGVDYVDGKLNAAKGGRRMIQVRNLEDLTSAEAARIVRYISGASESEGEIRQRLSNAGFDGDSAEMVSARSGSLFLAMVKVRGPRGGMIGGY